jgi:AraC family transcriptional regulator of adaptative response/methylated-DNA-[protein]-cysteine methyltransferase
MKFRGGINRRLKASFVRHPPSVVRWGFCAYGAFKLVVGVTEKGEICRLSFARSTGRRAVPSLWKKSWPNTDFSRDGKAVAPVARALDAGGEIDLLMVGTEFQGKIWRNLLDIPYGEVVAYSELAQRAGAPKAARAVGAACGANPVPILVPCHRVIASDGSLGGFSCGLAVKRKLINRLFPASNG